MAPCARTFSLSSGDNRSMYTFPSRWSYSCCSSSKRETSAGRKRREVGQLAVRLSHQYSTVCIYSCIYSYRPCVSSPFKHWNVPDGNAGLSTGPRGYVSPGFSASCHHTVVTTHPCILLPQPGSGTVGGTGYPPGRIKNWQWRQTVPTAHLQFMGRRPPRAKV